MTTRAELEELLSRVTALKTLKRLTLKYFGNLMAEWDGTPEAFQEILMEADPFYDYPGMPSTLAKALTLNKYELSMMLARTRQVTCSQCGVSFRAVERRRVGGYTVDYRSMCDRCEQSSRHYSQPSFCDDQRQQKRLEVAKMWHSDWLQKIETDTLIFSTVEAKQDPLTIEPLRKHLICYGFYWLCGYPSTRYKHFGQGCMICGCKPPLLMVAKPEHSCTLQQSGTWEFLNMPAKDGMRDSPLSNSADLFAEAIAQLPPLPAWAPLSSVYQSLWRAEPAPYFDKAHYYPVLNLPLLMLCEKCAHFVNHTHTRVELGNVRVELLEDKKVAYVENDEIGLTISVIEDHPTRMVIFDRTPTGK